MPKQKITKEMVVDAAFALARAGGMAQVMVKNIAEKLGCSVQPIYSYCKNMDGLRNDVEQQAKRFVQKYIAEHINKENLFQSTGQAYIQLAREEPNILKLFIFQKRYNVSSMDELYQSETDPQMAGFISDTFNITLEKAKQLHLDMLIYTIGIGTIFSVTQPGIPAEEIYAQQDRVYQLFLKGIQEYKI